MVTEGSGKHAFGGVAQRVIEIVGGSTGRRYAGNRGHHAFVIAAFELEAEERQSAVVGLCESVGLAASRTTHQYYIDIDAAQRADE